MFNMFANATFFVVAVETHQLHHDGVLWHRHVAVSLSPTLVLAEGVEPEDLFDDMVFTLQSKYPCEDCMINYEDFVDYLSDLVANPSEVAVWYLQLQSPGEFKLVWKDDEDVFSELPCDVDDIVVQEPEQW